MKILILLTLLPIQGEMISGSCDTGWHRDFSTPLFPWASNGPCEEALLQEDRGYISWDMGEPDVIKLTYPIAVNRITIELALGIEPIARFSSASMSVDGNNWILVDRSEFVPTGEAGVFFRSPNETPSVYDIMTATVDVPSTSVLYVRGVETEIVDTEYKTDYVSVRGQGTPGQAPVAWFTEPVHRRKILGLTTVSIDAYDDGPLKKVAFYLRHPQLKAVRICVDTIAPYSCVLDVSEFEPETYRLKARVVDFDGMVTNEVITVFIVGATGFKETAGDTGGELEK